MRAWIIANLTIAVVVTLFVGLIVGYGIGAYDWNLGLTPMVPQNQIVAQQTIAPIVAPPVAQGNVAVNGVLLTPAEQALVDAVAAANPDADVVVNVPAR